MRPKRGAQRGWPHAAGAEERRRGRHFYEQLGKRTSRQAGSLAGKPASVKCPTTHTYTCKYGRVRIHYLGECLAYSGSPPRVLKCHLLSQARGHALPTTDARRHCSNTSTQQEPSRRSNAATTAASPQRSQAARHAAGSLASTGDNAASASTIEKIWPSKTTTPTAASPDPCLDATNGWKMT